MRDMINSVKYYSKLLIDLIVFKLKETRRFLVFRSKRIAEKPNTIQLPITYMCNFDCVMCGMKNLSGKKDFSAEELDAIFQDELFSEVSTVGINGGEPFLKRDLIECVNVMINRLPKLNTINIISNGFFTDLVLDKTKKLYECCKNNGISLNLSLSLDGINDMQDFHRGHIGSFKNICKTIDQLRNEKCYDGLQMICTITRYNIFRINEVETWAKENGLKVLYNIATENVRIANEERVDNFSLFSDEKARMMAQEFFYHLFSETRSERYYAIYLFLNRRVRYADCPHQYNKWITLTPNGQVSFCATHSKELGNCLDQSAYTIVKNNISYLQALCNEKCETCSHYIQSLNEAGLKEMHKDIIKNNYLRRRIK